MIKSLLLLLFVIELKKRTVTAFSSATQSIVFNIDNGFDKHTNLLYRQSFNQSTINYCNFDPFLLNNKRKTNNAEYTHSTETNYNELKVNVFTADNYFNDESQISVNVQFHNKQAESSKLWYLLEAKSVCTNQVVGVWRLKQHKNTDTIYCFKPDDTLFGHKSRSEDTLFEQIWTPVNTFEDVYFVLAIFTDEIYSDLNPTYYLVSSSIIKYKSIVHASDDHSAEDYEKKCDKLNTNISKDSDSKHINILNTPSTASVTTTNSLIKDIIAYSTKPMLAVNSFSNSNRFNSISSEKSILVNLVGNLYDCNRVSFESEITGLVKSKLEIIYSKIPNFLRLEIINIFNKDCDVSRKINSQNIVFQHYVLFDEPVKSEIKLNLVNTLKNYLASEPKFTNLKLIESFLLNENGTKVLLKNVSTTCDLYDYLNICQNAAICQQNSNSAVSCHCQPGWIGQFCDRKYEQSIDDDKIKMFITIACLASFAVISLLTLLIYVIYKRRKQKKIIKRAITERSKICTASTNSSSSNETSINDEYPRLNNYNSNLNTISYPRELIIASSPIKKNQLNRKKSTDESSKGPMVVTIVSGQNLNSRKNSEPCAEQSHINYGYNLTFNSDMLLNEEDSFKKIIPNQQSSMSFRDPEANNEFNLKAFWKNESNLDNIIHHKSDLFKNQRRADTNSIPHSLEKQMAMNLHNLTYNSSPANSTTLETGSDFINRYSKYTDSTSISTEHSLKDEDAWLPILNLAEEQILKYQNEEEARDMEFCVM